MWRNVARIIALALLAFTGAAGIYNGVTELDDVTNRLQAVVTGGVFGYGVLGTAAVVAALGRRPATKWLAGAWGAAVTMVASLAPIAYGEGEVPVMVALAGGAATAAIAAGVWWAVRSPAPIPRRSE